MEQPSAPAPSENSLIEQRREKLAKLREKGIDPFKNKFTPDRKCDEARGGFDKGELPEGTKVSVAGRITAHREMGKSMFIDVRDQSGRIQIYAQKNALGDEHWNIFTHLDLGDFIGVTGTLFRTKTGEPSIKLEAFTILAKALRPPPAKWHGLEDTEIRYRQRYLDLMGNPEVKQTFLKRSAIVHEIRQFFHSRGYVEVETPAMQAIPGGAAAQPFKTFHNALGCDFYLRIALELYHKRLLVGGIDKLFEIGKNFRNEGLSRRHNPEFTMLEAYCAFGDYESMMETVEALITGVAEKVNSHMPEAERLLIKHNRRTEFKTLLVSFRGNLTDFIRIVDELQNAEIQKAKLKDLDQWILDLIKLADEKAPEELVRDAEVYLQQAEQRQILLSANISQWNLTTASSAVLHQSRMGMRTFLARLAEFRQPKIIDLARPWRRVNYRDLIRERIHPDWFDWAVEQRLDYAEEVLEVHVTGRPQRKLEQTDRLQRELFERIQAYLAQGVRFADLPASDRDAVNQANAEFSQRVNQAAEGVASFEIDQAVFEKYIEPTLIQPTFVTHLPKELVPLAKLSPDDPTTVEVFECCINGQEIAPGYTEQNDPIAQRNTLEHQAGGEQQKLDEDFLVALEHGMPPAGGIGIGIDRLCMMLLGQESIRDVILFPQLKPK